MVGIAKYGTLIVVNKDQVGVIWTIRQKCVFKFKKPESIIWEVGPLVPSFMVLCLILPLYFLLG